MNPKLAESFTDRMYVGLRAGRCVAIAREYKTDAKENRRTRIEWAKEGLDVLTVPESKMAPYYEDMKTLIREREAEKLL